MIDHDVNMDSPEPIIEVNENEQPPSPRSRSVTPESPPPGPQDGIIYVFLYVLLTRSNFQMVMWK